MNLRKSDGNGMPRITSHELPCELEFTRDIGLTLVVELVARARRLLYTEFLPKLGESNLANHSSDLLLDLRHCGDCNSLRSLVVYLPTAAAD